MISVKLFSKAVQSGADGYVVCVQHLEGEQQSRSMPTDPDIKMLQQDEKLSPEAK